MLENHSSFQNVIPSFQGMHNAMENLAFAHSEPEWSRVYGRFEEILDETRLITEEMLERAENFIVDYTQTVPDQAREEAAETLLNALDKVLDLTKYLLSTIDMLQQNISRSQAGALKRRTLASLDSEQGFLYRTYRQLDALHLDLLSACAKKEKNAPIFTCADDLFNHLNRP